MREHTIGAYGAVALGVDLLVKAAALAALAERDRVVVSAIAAGALSRSVAVVLGSALESVRDDGAGAVFRVSRLGALVAAALGVGIAVVTGIADGAVLAAVAAAAAVALAVFYRRWLGGATGDLLGAAAELTETAVLVAAVAIS
jgi:adenosylcobinamide-GDP ribazoletransferase